MMSPLYAEDTAKCVKVDWIASEIIQKYASVLKMITHNWGWVQTVDMFLTLYPWCVCVCLSHLSVSVCFCWPVCLW